MNLSDGLNFSPGIRSDNPAFGLAMWSNTPASGDFQGGFYPQGPSAVPVGTPARPLLDLLHGRNRMDNNGASGERATSSRGGTLHQGNEEQAPDPLGELQHWGGLHRLHIQCLLKC